MGLDLDWPTTPADDGSVRSLSEVAAGSTEAGPHAALLDRYIQEKVVAPETADTQVVVETKLGPVTLPSVVSGPEQKRIIFSHAGEWDNGDLDRLQRWTQRVRASEPGRDTLIEVLCDLDDCPRAVDDIVSTSPVSRLAILAAPNLADDTPSANALLLQQLLRHVFGETIDFTPEGLMLLDHIVTQQIGPIDDHFFFRRTMICLIGAFLGESIVRTIGGAWAHPPGELPPWMKLVKMGETTLSPMGRVSKILRSPETEPEKLVAFYDEASEQAEKAGHPRGQLPDVDISENGRRRIYRILARLAMCDGSIDQAERDRLNHYRDRFGFDAEQTKRIEAEALAGKELHVGKNPAEREFLALAMTDIVAADGILAKAEENRLVRLFKTINIDPGQMIGWLKVALEPGQKPKGPPPGSSDAKDSGGSTQITLAEEDREGA